MLAIDYLHMFGKGLERKVNRNYEYVYDYHILAKLVSQLNSSELGDIYVAVYYL